MSAYLTVKTLHVVSATVLLGTGAGIAFFMWRAWQSQDVHLIAGVARIVVLADWLFTLPAVIIQLVTGLYLVEHRGLPLFEGWIGLTLLLYAFIGACWIPVVWLQLRIRAFATQAQQAGTALDAQCVRYFRLWFFLGWPAFAGVLLIIWLMVNQRLPGS